MTKSKKCFIWFYMLTKRLLKEWSFLLIAALIPVTVFITLSAMSGESGVLHIVLCNEDDGTSSQKIISSLLSKESVIRFSHCDTRQEAQDAVTSLKADAVWVFNKGFEDLLSDFTYGKYSNTPVEIFEREETVSLKISREILFGAIYNEASYRLYYNYSKDNFLSKKGITHADIQKAYDTSQDIGGIIEIERLNSNTPENSSGNYLTAPIRGILSLIIMLCSLSGALYFLKDKSKGVYDWLTPRKRILPAIASSLSASVISALAVMVTVYMSGLSRGIVLEICSMILFVISVTGFCTLFALVFRSHGVLGALIPGILIVALVLSPIFFNFKILKPVRLMLPTYYYLQALYNTKYLLYSVFYIVSVYAICFVINCRNRVGG